MNNVSWRGIRAFIHVAELGSFTAAAEALGGSKANISQLVTDLENALGVQLLFRTTRQLRLTEIGDGYYQRCKGAMQQLDSAAEWATESRSELKGRIRMNSVGGPIGEELIAPLVMSFQKQYPNITVELDFSNLQVDLLGEQYDLVLRVGALPDSTLVARHLCNLSTCYVASPDFLEQHGPIERPEDLADLPLIYGSVEHWILKKGSEQRVIHTNTNQGMKAATGRTMRQAALAGLGVTRLTDVYCHADLASNKLIDVLPDWAEETPLSLVCPPTKFHLQRVKTLMDWIIERFSKGY
ncbi:LysR family transcriptional regulator [Vibrio vulnificus]|uniref:LysR family transcriptional regulator n=1 Tax=Vibrio vulnificus TaxID=672 RepID=UPI0015F8F44F|nr:LysR family transcriptional regulator [Vibrio vulnificus]MCA0763932.1 LysR family transcriptional regulator [Vibrio vulnificus]MDT9655277.1 LysR substrate-binding domain-containing protein [Vibrio vulnificus]QMV39193.1 LysR family transcriptional regulator [Vibrio vulnificus]HAS6164691.1 LysR family transcriptional regulator [Vibrio vulnificus]HAT8541553.1 LysR family transcriptional regulator [Vibrio vulnificus]